MRAPDGGVLRCCTSLHFVALHQTCRKPNKIAICCTVALESAISRFCPPERRLASSLFLTVSQFEQHPNGHIASVCQTVRVQTASAPRGCITRRRNTC